MKRWQKILLVGFHAVMLTLFLCMILAGVQLRWRLGYILFWGAVLSGMTFYFIRDNSLSNESSRGSIATPSSVVSPLSKSP